MTPNAALRIAAVVAVVAVLVACGGGGGGGSGGSPQEPPAPQISAVTAAVLSDGGTVFPTGRLVRIDIQETAGATIASGSIRITSASQGYDSGEQPLKFGSIFYEWDTTGLQPASDYAVSVTLTDASARSTTNDALVVTLAPNPPAINKLVSTVDVSVAARGFPVNIVRSYLLDSKFDGPIGYGWTHSYRMRAVETRTKIIQLGQAIQVDGTVQIFNADGTGSVFTPIGSGNYRASAGDFRTLTKAAGGSYTLRGKHGNRFTFAATGELTSLADRNGNTQTLSYDGSGRLTTITDASGRRTVFSYDANSRITTITDPLGRAATYGYDAGGNLVAVTNHAGVSTRYAYDASHGLTTVTDPLGKRTFFTFDANRRLASVAGEGGANRVSFQYAQPAVDQMTVTDALGQATVLTHDNAGLVTRVVDAAGNTSAMTYDVQRNLTALVDANGGRSTFSFDAQGNLLTSTDALGGTTTLTYAAPFSQLASLRDARGKTTAFAYDAQGNLTGMTYPGGARETYTYDAAGLLASKTDRKGQTIAFTYDGTGRLTRKSFPDGSSHRFSYDAAGNLVSAVDASGTIALAYDAQDRLVRVTHPGGDVVSYAYDAADNRTQLVYPTGKTLSYSYDGLNRLIQISEAGQAVARYTYDALGRVTRRELKNGTFTTYAYDSASRLVDLVNRKSPTEVISSFAYTHDRSGNRLTMTTLAGTTRYAYDAIDQLISVVRSDSTVTQYNLDAAGNRASVSDTRGTVAYSTNDLNQYTSVGSDTYQYDTNGNLAAKTSATGTTTHTYDFENRLVGVTTPTETLNYTYDLFGRRTSKSTRSGRIDFVHDGLSVIVERTGASMQAIYVHGLGIDEVLIMFRGGLEYFYSHDGLGSVTDLTDSGISLVESYSYDVYGNPNTTSQLGNPFLFSGREFELESGLYFNRARYYDPSAGRFVSADPSGFQGGGNLYSYVVNNPVSFSDALGLKRRKRNGGLKPKEVEELTDILGQLSDIFEVIGDLQQFKKGKSYWWHADRFGNIDKDLVNARDIELLAACQYRRSQGKGCNYEWWDKNGRLWQGHIPTADDLRVPDGANSNSSESGGDGGPRCSDRNACFADPTFIQTNSGTPKPKTEARRSGKGWAISYASLVAELAVPTTNSLVRADVPFFGIASGTQFKSYRLEFGEGDTPTKWFQLASSNVHKPDATPSTALATPADGTIRGNLGNWDTGLREYVYLPTYPIDHPIDFRGTHTLRLVVEGRDGTTVEDRVTVHVASVIPNAWGARVTSKDGRFILDVPEQALMDSFRLVLAQPAQASARPAAARFTRAGPLWEVREPGERFTKEATLRLAYDAAQLGRLSPERLTIHGYSEARKRWERLPSQRSREGQWVTAKVRRLHSHYALLVSPDASIRAPLEPEQVMTADASAAAARATAGAAGPFLIRNDFEHDTGQWSNRDNEVGGVVSLDGTATFDGTKALKITNPRGGGSNFAVNVIGQPFDARDFPLVQFDYRIPRGVKTNFLVKVAGRWYDIGFTDDPKELRDKRVNIAHIGDIEGVVADDQWHTARFNLHDILRTHTRNTVVEEMVMADWDVGGYMKLQFGTNAKGATYWIDNFSIGRDAAAGQRFDDARLLIDDFDQKEPSNALGGATTTFASADGGRVAAVFDEAPVEGQGHALRLDYDVAVPGSWSGYVTALHGLDLRGHQALTLRVRRGVAEGDLLVGLKDRAGHESKVRLSNHLPPRVAGEWQSVVIPLAAFEAIRDWGGIDNLSLSFTHETNTSGASGASGAIWVDDLMFEQQLEALRVADFERADRRNSIGLAHAAQAEGGATLEAATVRNSPNGVQRLVFGGSIGGMTGIRGAPGDAAKGWARWATQLGGIDCTRCGDLSFRIRGEAGSEDMTIYLDDGNFRWGVQLSKLVQVGTDWQTVRVPLKAFADYGVNLTHLAELQVVFEGHPMSGTVYLDDIRLGPREP